MLGINTAAIRHASTELDGVAKLVEQIDVTPLTRHGAAQLDPDLARLVSDAKGGLDRAKQHLRDGGVIAQTDWGSGAPGASLLPHIELDIVHLRSAIDDIRSGAIELRRADPTRGRSMTEVLAGWDGRDAAKHVRLGRRMLEDAEGLKTGIKPLFDAPQVQAQRMQTAARLGDSLDRAGVRMLQSPTELTERLRPGAVIDASDDGIRALAHLAHKERLMNSQTYRAIIGDATSAPNLPEAWRGEGGAARMVDDLRQAKVDLDARNSRPRWYPERPW